MDEYPVPSENTFDSITLGVFLLAIIVWAIVGIAIGKISASMNLKIGVIFGWVLPPSMAVIVSSLWFARLGVDYLLLTTLAMAALVSFIGFRTVNSLQKTE